MLSTTFLRICVHASSSATPRRPFHQSRPSSVRLLCTASSSRVRTGVVRVDIPRNERVESAISRARALGGERDSSKESLVGFPLAEREVIVSKSSLNESLSVCKRRTPLASAGISFPREGESFFSFLVSSVRPLFRSVLASNSEHPRVTHTHVGGEEEEEKPSRTRRPSDSFFSVSTGERDAENLLSNLLSSSPLSSTLERLSVDDDGAGQEKSVKGRRTDRRAARLDLNLARSPSRSLSSVVEQFRAGTSSLARSSACSHARQVRLFSSTFPAVPRGRTLAQLAPLLSPLSAP